MFNWLFAKREKGPSIPSELAMRANIANKLKSYKVEEDTTISQFSLADEEKEKKALNKTSPIRSGDVWGLANPGETGKWKRDVRHTGTGSRR